MIDEGVARYVATRFPLNDSDQNEPHNGVNSVANFQVQTMSGCKLLKRLVPGAGVEPAPPYEERILSPFPRCLPNGTTHDQAVFTDVPAVKASYVRLGLDT